MLEVPTRSDCYKSVEFYSCRNIFVENNISIKRKAKLNCKIVKKKYQRTAMLYFCIFGKSLLFDLGIQNITDYGEFKSQQKNLFLSAPR